MLEYDGNDGHGYTRIDSVDELRKVLGFGIREFKIMLSYGAYSTKDIMVLPDGRFKVWNNIDDTRQTLTGIELLDPSMTCIGEAIDKKALWMYGKFSDN